MADSIWNQTLEIFAKILNTYLLQCSVIQKSKLASTHSNLARRQLSR